MNRKTFLERLDMLLCDIPKEEREEAIQYYEDYFDDAGAENEAGVIEELESPEKVAAVIRAGMEPGKDEYSEYSETGYSDVRFEDRKVPEPREGSFRSGSENQKGEAFDEGDTVYESRAFDTGGAARREESEEYGTYGTHGTTAEEFQYSGTAEGKSGKADTEGPWTSNVLKVILVVAIIVVAVPVGGPILLGIAALIFGLIVAFAGIFVGLIVAGFAIAISGIAVIGVGIAKMFTWQPGGIMMLGTGLILLALGTLLTAVMVKATGIVFPAAFRGVVDLVRKPFHRKGRGGA